MSNNGWPDKAIFIVAPRELSVRRFTEILRHYLPKGDIILGIAKEEYVLGFENQPQFRMLRQHTVQSIIDKVQSSVSRHKVIPFAYSQSDLHVVIEGLTSENRVLLINGSWKYAFHNSPAFKVLQSNNVPMKYISPFIDEEEAKAFEASHSTEFEAPAAGTLVSENEMFEIADRAALQSFDYSFQTGVAAGKKNGDKYEFLSAAFNKVIPYQTYAMHHGNMREKHQSQPHDTNHYDTIHAEMLFLTNAIRDGLDITGATLFINLLPCPNCARTLSQTTVSELIYRHDHSGGYAKDLLKICGKKVRQLS